MAVNRDSLIQLARSFSPEYLRAVGIQTLAVGVSYVIHISYAQNLSVERYGVITLGLGYLSLLTMLAKFGIDTDYLKHQDRRSASDRSLNTQIVAVNAIIGLFVIMLLKKWNANFQSTWYILLGLPAYALLNYRQCELRAESQFQKALILPILWTSLSALIVLFSHGLGYFKFGLLSFGVVASLLLICVIDIPLRSYSASGFREFCLVNRRGFPYIIADGVQQINSRVDLIVLSWIGVLSEIAIYELSFRLTMAFALVVNSFTFVLGPKIAKSLHEGDAGGAGKESMKFSAVIGILGGVFVLVIWLVGDIVLGFFGNAYVESKDILLVLAFSQVLSATSGPFGIRLTLGEERNWMIKYASVSIGFNVLSSIIVYPWFGLMGVAVTTLISNGLKLLLFLGKTLQIRRL